jgi:hypothetical protein
MIPEISVILQGPVVNDIYPPSGLPTTFYAIRKVRELLPKSEIIVSTWEGQDTALLEADIVICSRDPGGQLSPVANGVINNVNRQIISTTSGLNVASSALALKIRSDTILTGTNFIKVFQKSKPPKAEWALFENRIISNNLSSRNPRAMPHMPLSFHPADHVHFGLLCDLKTLWDIPLQSDEDAEFFMRHPRPDRFRDCRETSRLTPEQYICTSAFSKKFPINMAHYVDPHVIDLSEKLLLNNFVFLADREFPIHLMKYHNEHHSKFEWMRYPAKKPWWKICGK